MSADWLPIASARKDGPLWLFCPAKDFGHCVHPEKRVFGYWLSRQRMWMAPAQPLAFPVGPSAPPWFGGGYVWPSHWAPAGAPETRP